MRLHVHNTDEVHLYNYIYILYIHVLMRDEKEEKKEVSKVKQTNKAKQHSTPKAVTFPKKNELPRVGLEHTTLYTYMYMKLAVSLFENVALSTS